MEKRLLIALALSFLILLVFQKSFKGGPSLFGARKTTYMETPTDTEAPVQQQPQEAIRPTPSALPETKKEPIEEKTAIIQTEKYTIVFSDAGGTIKEISLKEYRDAEKEGEYLLCESAPAEGMFGMTMGILPAVENARYKMTKGANFIEYKFTEPGLIEITKRYNFYKPFDYIDLAIKIKNISPRNVSFSYDIKGPAGITKSDKIVGRSFLESATMIDDKVVRKRSVKGTFEATGNISWTALKNRYFALIVKPFEPPKAVLVKQTSGGDLFAVLKSRNYTLGPGENLNEDYLLFAGPQDEKTLAAIGHGMENVVDYGFFAPISRTLLSILRFFQKGVKNWGVAIILLTLLINAVLFPLTKKSVISMHQMKKVQPHMQKLKELHKDNPQKLNKEMMELYKKYNVNPLSGCLPLLLQMPVFISLYQGLIRSIELKGASFLWVKDLARPDAVKLPFSLPVIGGSINILPLLMVGMMVLQQKTSQVASAAAMTDEQASQQKMMMIIFPLVFGFLFYKMPAGLVLYWLTNTILMTTEQKLLGKRLNQE